LPYQSYPGQLTAPLTDQQNNAIWLGQLGANGGLNSQQTQMNALQGIANG